MKSLLLVVFSFFILLFLSIVCLRRYKGKKYLHVFFLAYAVTLVVYIIFYHVLPADLGFLPPAFLDDSPQIGFWNGLLIFSLVFHIFADVSYTTVLTGFSTNLIVHIAKKGRLSAKQVQDIYGVTNLYDPVTDWRLDNLIQGKYITAVPDGYCLLFKGKMVALATLFLQKLFNTGEGG